MHHELRQFATQALFGSGLVLIAGLVCLIATLNGQAVDYELGLGLSIIYMLIGLVGGLYSFFGLRRLRPRTDKST